MRDGEPIDIGKKASQVELQLNLAYEAIDRLKALNDDLISRLAVVLRNPEITKGKDVAKETTSLVPIAAEINGISEKINEQADGLRDLLDRLEI